MTETTICANCWYSVQDQKMHILCCSYKKEVDYVTGKQRMIPCYSINTDGRCPYYKSSNKNKNKQILYG